MYKINILSSWLLLLVVMCPHKDKHSFQSQASLHMTLLSSFSHHPSEVSGTKNLGLDLQAPTEKASWNSQCLWSLLWGRHGEDPWDSLVIQSCWITELQIQWMVEGDRRKHLMQTPDFSCTQYTNSYTYIYREEPRVSGWVTYWMHILEGLGVWASLCR